MQVSLPSIDDLRTLSNVQEQPCLTITLPTDGFAADARMGTTRIKNLLRAAEEAIRKAELQNGTGERLLAPIRELSDKSDFWRQQDQGLALFVSPGLDGGSVRAYSTPFRLPEEVLVGKRFHLASMLPFVSADGSFYVLVLGKQGVRFYRGTRGTVRQIQVEGMPDSFQDVQKYFEHERHHHFSPASQGRSPGGQSAFAGHGLDAEDRDDIKRRVVIYLQQIDRALKPLFTGRRDPLVLLALDYLHPLWREACTYNGYLEEASVKHDAEIVDDKQVLELVWPKIEPVLRQTAQDALARFKEGKGTGLVTTDVQEVLPAAAEGRVGTLLVAERPHRLTGRFDAASRHTEIQQVLPPAPTAAGARAEEQVVDVDGEDLIDRAVAETLNHGGDVLAVPADELPDNRSMAALLRY